MALNKSKGNMYDFITHTWNTIKGECLHDCSYCYMKRWGKLNPVRFDEKELKTDLGKDNFIFVGSSCDMFAMDIPMLWIIKTLNHCSKFDNTYLFQTKNPEALLSSIGSFMPPKIKFCTTIESNQWHDEMGKAPEPLRRARAMHSLSDVIECFVTIEPIMNFDVEMMVEMIKYCNPKQVNIGADSGNNNLPEPSKEKLLQLIDELKKFTTIHKKSNLSRILNK